MNPDDPKFTAHALGELEDLTPEERAEIEALLANDPAAFAEAAETIALAERLRAELLKEDAVSLSEDQRIALFETAVLPKIVELESKPRSFRDRVPVRVWGLAASIVVLAGLFALYGIIAFEGRKAVLAGSGISDPRSLSDAHPLERFAMQVGGAVTGQDTSVLQPATPAPLEAPSEPVAPPNGVPVPPLVLGNGAIALSPAPASPVILPAKPVGDKSAGLKQDGSSSLTFGEVPATPAPAGPAAAGGMLLATDDSSIRGNTRTPSATAPRAQNAPASPLVSLRLDEQLAASAEPQRGLTVADRGAVVRESPDMLERVPAELQKNLGELAKAKENTSAAAFEERTENAFLPAQKQPLSTFSIDVDTASYAIVRRFLENQQLPPKGAVRIEELLNYFTYDYPQPAGTAPFSATMEVAACPWTPQHRLVRIGLKGREVAKDKRGASNLVFLLDVSGSMNQPNKLPLLQQSLGLLVDQLGGEDRVAIVVYAGQSGCVLEPTNDKAQMRAALGKLQAGGSTNGASGLQLAYQLAEKSFIKGGTNRVILATDGDWNVGVTSRSDLLDLIAQKARTGVFLTVLGFGMDNLKDAMMVQLANRGNGQYAYVDSLLEAKKVLVDQLSGTLVTIAKDVKIQVEFNPAQVNAYRLIGYEKRMLAKEDFNNDKKDAGEIGAGHTVTALYEIVPAGVEHAPRIAAVDPLKYQPATRAEERGVTPAVPMPEVPPRSNRPPERAPMDAKPYLLEQQPANAAGKPEDAFLGAYMSVQKAEKAEKAGNLVMALAEYRRAAARFEEIAAQHSGWQPAIVAYRQRRTANAIAAVQARIAAATAPAPAAPPTGTVPPPEASDPLLRADAEILKSEQELLQPRAADQNEVNAPAAPAAVPATPALTAAAPATPPALSPAASRELLTLKLRYKEPEGETSKLLTFPLTDAGKSWAQSSPDLRFAAAVAGYGMLLRDSEYRGEVTWAGVAEWAVEGRGTDVSGYRADFLALIEKARALTR